jgi:hypothetical protein
MHALYAIVSCAGAAGSVASCGAGAMGAAALSLITNLLTDNPNETAQERETEGKRADVQGVPNDLHEKQQAYALREQAIVKATTVI